MDLVLNKLELLAIAGACLIFLSGLILADLTFAITPDLGSEVCLAVITGLDFLIALFFRSVRHCCH